MTVEVTGIGPIEFWPYIEKEPPMTDREELIYLRRLVRVQKRNEHSDRVTDRERVVAERMMHLGEDWNACASWLRTHGWTQSPLGFWELPRAEGYRPARIYDLGSIERIAFRAADVMERNREEVLAEMLTADGPWDQAYVPTKSLAAE